MLPKLDGFQLLAELRKSRQTPALFLTARDAVADRIQGLNIGADDYLVKPFDLTELNARIKAIRVNGKPVVATAREYAILEYMMSHIGKVISRDELYAHVFDDDDEAADADVQPIPVESMPKELRHLADALNHTFQRLSAAFVRQQQFTSDAAHELRNPLAVLLSETQLALLKTRSAEEYCETIRTCGSVANDMR